MAKTIKLSEENKDFFEQVYQVVRLIPTGKVTSYGAVANYLGRKGGARMVGWAMNASHSQAKYVPAHRVVNRLGLLTGKAHFNPPESMEIELGKEGILVIDDQIQDFKIHYWDPSIALL
jgi:methylated-DNA-protein-cysteine methyltransferase-like protein